MTIKIHPHKYTIYGWENSRSLENVISIMVGLVEGDKIPHVILHTFNGGESFEIAFFKAGVNITLGRGGHHRLIAANMLESVLEVKIESFKEKEDYYMGILSSKKLYDIKEIKLISRPSWFYDGTKKRPIPSLRKFFGKYKEINKALKHGPKDYSFTRAEYRKFLEHLEKCKILIPSIVPF